MTCVQERCNVLYASDECVTQTSVCTHTHTHTHTIADTQIHTHKSRHTDAQTHARTIIWCVHVHILV